MRLHISLPDDLAAEVDRRAGARRRSAYVVSAVRKALDDEQRWELIESAFGSIEDSGHAWDADPAAWVEEQRFADRGRVG